MEEKVIRPALQKLGKKPLEGAAAQNRESQSL